ncbi:mechnosensitive channel protein MscS [Ignicoccus pacificus DSM 13166]|uniref:Mechnosensitive channel protein MscS n=1 Tax=Ignicoccus pacificus DSM 13166 TaxID=940294 RepID=A0A977PKF9_9CREN|nr:mechnosensitive channel protein MscS [Ignicoccus pacificus DSM 13166]
MDLVIGIAIIVLTRTYLHKKVVEVLARYVTSEDVMFMVQWVSAAVLYLIGFALILTAFGISISSLLVAGGFITLAISFAAQTTISNAISGIFLLMEKPVKIGDLVIIKDSGVGGVVKSISILSTTVRLWNGELARIPNSKFFESVIINQSGPLVRRLEVEVGVPYDLDKVKRAVEALKRFLDKEKYILKVPEPEVFVKDFGDSAIIIRINAWVPTKKWYEVYKEIRMKIYEKLVSEGVDIPYTTITVIDRRSSSTSGASQSEGS